MRLALFEPDIPPNAGTMLRMAACLNVPVDVIEPCGFPFTDKNFKRAGMDYLDFAQVKRHINFAAFDEWRRAENHRLVLVETTGTMRHVDFRYQPNDILMVGRETAGTPAEVEVVCDAVVRIPMRPGVRSLNVAIAAAVALAEALRQTEGFPA